MEPAYVTRDELRADLGDLRDELIKWMVGTGIAIAGIAASLSAVFARLLLP